MSVGADGDLESPGKAKVSDFEHTVAVDQEVLRLEVAVHDPACVAEVHSARQLVHVRLDQHRLHPVHARLVHVLLQVLVEPLKDEVQTVLAVLDIEKPDDNDEVVARERRVRARRCGTLWGRVGVRRGKFSSGRCERYDFRNADSLDDVGMVELLEKRDLPEGRRRHALVLNFEADLFESDSRARGDLLRPVDDSVRALSNGLVDLLVLGKEASRRHGCWLRGEKVQEGPGRR